MNFYILETPAALKPYVRCFWVLEHEFGKNESNYIYRSVADGCTEIVFHYRSSFIELVTDGRPHNWHSGIHFQSNSYRRFETRQSFGIFGAYIYPFAIPYFFNVPSERTSNEMLDLHTFLGKEGLELEERIMIASDNYERAEILAAYLKKRLVNVKVMNDTVASAIKHVIHSPQTSTVNQLAGKFNLSVRQFDRKFKEYAGLVQKHICAL